MKSYDYEVVTYDGGVFCVGCLPEDVDVEDEDVHPIFADQEWDYILVCRNCGREHDYMNIFSDDEEDGDHDD
jgi:hypothetical protein